MTTAAHLPDLARAGGYVVRSPRATDAVGRALRSVFAEREVPHDLMVLLHRLDQIAH